MESRSADPLPRTAGSLPGVAEPLDNSTRPAGLGALWAGVGARLTVRRDVSILDLFEAVAAGRPDRPAIRFRDQVATYGQLNADADALAGRLRAAGTRAGDFVPLVISEGLAFPVGLLAAMKLAAPFVPIDPHWPLARLRELFRQLDAPAILSVTEHAPTLELLGLSERVVTADDGGARGGPVGPPGPRPGPGDLIYGYFTSGSTGTPKCALNRHGGLVNRMAAMSAHFGAGAGQVVLQNSKPTFDSSMWQLLWPLTTGGVVVLPDRRGILDLEQTCHTLSRYAITITDFVPSVLAALVGLLELRPDLRAGLGGLRRMLIGGEEANGAVLARLRELLPGLRVTNTFGPTECSIGSVFHDIDLRDIEEASGRIPLGTPIPNTAAVVLDDERHPVPPETIGEIYIGGRCVGAGYLSDPERTARAFVPNPFPQIEGDLLYRTGDLGHVTPAGLLMFDGRRDDQVKVGGVRVELAEVERVLGTHPSVRMAAVAVRGQGDARSLAAFVTTRTGTTVAPADLLDWLRGHLPPETLPRTVSVVAAIPLTPHGKLDRQTLAQWARDAAGPADTQPAEPPATADEEHIASVWREVLNRDYISVTASFAGYGGTSLLTHRVAAMLGARLGRCPRMADLLSADTVRAQARLLGDEVRPVLDAVTLAHDPDPAADAAALAREVDAAGLLPAVVAAAPPAARRILLTGATGFVGAHVLAELLVRAHTPVVCLVRAGDPASGAARLVTALRRYGLDEALPALERGLAAGSVRVLPGDLGATRLGLDETGFRDLAREVDAVLHAGAMVNFLRGYADHRGPNVSGTAELIRLAAAGDGARLHLLSTFSVYAEAGGPRPDPIAENGLPELTGPPEGGYHQSKFVAEHLVADARRRGLDAVVYRLGEVWPHRRTGRPNPASLAHSVVYAAARTGIVFATRARTDHLPVDVVAEYLVDAATVARPTADTVHLIRPDGLGYAEMFEELRRGGARPAGYRRFRSRLAELAERDGADERLVRVAMLLPDPEPGSRATPAAFDRMFTDGSTRFAAGVMLDHAPTRAALAAGTPLTDVATFLSRLGMEE
jgi:amino acid adenylation domain-containing protein/thioester reductase-like protein